MLGVPWVFRKHIRIYPAYAMQVSNSARVYAVMKRSGSDESLNRKRAERVASRRGAVVEIARSIVVPSVQSNMTLSYQNELTDTCKHVDGMHNLTHADREELERLKDIITKKLAA